MYACFIIMVTVHRVFITQRVAFWTSPLWMTSGSMTDPCAAIDKHGDRFAELEPFSAGWCLSEYTAGVNGVVPGDGVTRW